MIRSAIVARQRRGQKVECALEEVAEVVGVTKRRIHAFLYEETRTMTYHEFIRIRDRWLDDLDRQAEALIAEGMALRAKAAAERVSGHIMTSKSPASPFTVGDIGYRDSPDKQ